MSDDSAAQKSFEKTSPFNVHKVEKALPVFQPATNQSEKTVKLANAPQSRAATEFKTMIAEEKPDASVRSPESSSEATVRLAPKIRTRTFEMSKPAASATNSEIKFKPEAQVGISSPAEAVLKQSENLRIAQARISSLEEELDRFRQQNSQLSSAGENFATSCR